MKLKPGFVIVIKLRKVNGYHINIRSGDKLEIVHFEGRRAKLRVVDARRMAINSYTYLNLVEGTYDVSLFETMKQRIKETQ